LSYLFLITRNCKDSRTERTHSLKSYLFLITRNCKDSNMTVGITLTCLTCSSLLGTAKTCKKSLTAGYMSYLFLISRNCKDTMARKKTFIDMSYLFLITTDD